MDKKNGKNNDKKDVAKKSDSQNEKQSAPGKDRDTSTGTAKKVSDKT